MLLDAGCIRPVVNAEADFLFVSSNQDTVFVKKSDFLVDSIKGIVYIKEDLSLELRKFDFSKGRVLLYDLGKFCGIIYCWSGMLKSYHKYERFFIQHLMENCSVTICLSIMA